MSCWMRSTCSKSHTSRLRRHSSCRLMWLWILALTCQGTHTISTSVKQSEHTCAALITNYCLSVASGISGVTYFSKINHSHPQCHMAQVSKSSMATFKEVSKNNVICYLSLSLSILMFQSAAFGNSACLR